MGRCVEILGRPDRMPSSETAQGSYRVATITAGARLYGALDPVGLGDESGESVAAASGCGAGSGRFRDWVRMLGSG